MSILRESSILALGCMALTLGTAPPATANQGAMFSRSSSLNSVVNYRGGRRGSEDCKDLFGSETDFLSQGTAVRDGSSQEDYIGLIKSSTPKAEIFGQLEQYRVLEENWNGYDAKAPSANAINDIKSFLDAYSGKLLPTPMVSPLGQVGLYWRDGDAYAEVGCWGDGTFSFYSAKGRDRSFCKSELVLPPDSLSLERINESIKAIIS